MAFLKPLLCSSGYIWILKAITALPDQPTTISGFATQNTKEPKFHSLKFCKILSDPSDGLAISGILQIPSGDGPFPVILLNHGYYNRAAYCSGDGTDLIAEILNQHDLPDRLV